ncbi:MAG: nucleotidyltransferase domain-containing protein [Thermoleophilia bacterium]|nr:nucleotidyltransferase domain-containing protein [Thermoleophilia bacterium]
MTLDELVAEAEVDSGIVGVVLGGSHGRGALVTEHSDLDVYVVAVDEEFRRRWADAHPFRHGDPIEVISISLPWLRDRPTPRTPEAYDAYALAHTRVLVDKLDGEVGRLVEERERVDPAGASEPLDDFVNYVYRARKSARAGRELAARLDAAEAVGPFLEFLFAAHGRVRPFNKWLGWELEHHPLGPPWTAAELLPRLERVLAGDPGELAALFREAEHVARATGHGETIDGWEPDVPWLRGYPSVEG